MIKPDNPRNMIKNEASFTNSMDFPTSDSIVKLLPNGHIACLTGLKYGDRSTCCIYSMENNQEVKRFHLEKQD